MPLHFWFERFASFYESAYISSYSFGVFRDTSCKSTKSHPGRGGCVSLKRLWRGWWRVGNADIAASTPTAAQSGYSRDE